MLRKLFTVFIFVFIAQAQAQQIGIQGQMRNQGGVVTGNFIAEVDGGGFFLEYPPEYSQDPIWDIVRNFPENSRPAVEALLCNMVNGIDNYDGAEAIINFVMNLDEEGTPTPTSGGGTLDIKVVVKLQIPGVGEISAEMSEHLVHNGRSASEAGQELGEGLSRTLSRFWESLFERIRLAIETYFPSHHKKRM